ncbi:hypothetical protein [Staphylococcus intermedius]|nr:hypothetical protein [Staphylococcus intermedius]PCF78206.1 hypothetical protein B4W70_11805 [Staphylococcus intermedius]
MIKFLLILVVTIAVYLFCKYIYVYVSKKLKESSITKNNYVVKNILLSSNHEGVDVFDIIVVLVITFSIF